MDIGLNEVKEFIRLIYSDTYDDFDLDIYVDGDSLVGRLRGKLFFKIDLEVAKSFDNCERKLALIKARATE